MSGSRLVFSGFKLRQIDDMPLNTKNTAMCLIKSHPYDVLV